MCVLWWHFRSFPWHLKAAVESQRNIRRNLSLLCSPLAPAEYNYSVALQLQLCSPKHVIKTWKQSNSVYSMRGRNKMMIFSETVKQIMQVLEWTGFQFELEDHQHCAEQRLEREMGPPLVLPKCFFMTLWNLCNFSFSLWSGVRPEECGWGTREHLNISLFKLSLQKKRLLTNSSRPREARKKV